MLRKKSVHRQLVLAPVNNQAHLRWRIAAELPDVPDRELALRRNPLAFCTWHPKLADDFRWHWASLFTRQAMP